MENQNFKAAVIVSLCSLACGISYSETYNMTFPSGQDNLGWWDENSWTPNGVPGANDDVIITGNSDGLQWLHLSNGPDVMRANNLTLDNACFDVNRAPSDWETAAPRLEVTNNLTSSGNKENYFLNTNLGTEGKGFKYVKVGGNFYVDNTTATYLGWSAYETFSKSNLSLTVEGRIEMAANTLLSVNSGSDNYGSTFVDMYAKIGGLSGTNGIIASRDTAARLSYIIFGENSNGVFAGGDFTGRFTKNFDNADLGGYVLEMDDKSNGGNAQILRIIANNGSPWNDATDITVNVLNGTLLMNNAEGATITKLDLQGGGTFGVVGATSSDNFGQVNVTSMTWASGTKIAITLDKNSGSADLITAYSFAFAEGDASDATYEFAFDFVGDDDLSIGSSYKIFSKEEGFTDEMIAKFVGTGIPSDFEAVFSSIGNDLYVTFNQIPEPAAIAAMLGAFALAFAAYKRRK